MGCVKLTGQILKDHILKEIDTFLFDADGVLWNGNDAIPGSAKSVQFLKDLGKRVVLVTNNSTKSRKSYLEKCQRLGFAAFTQEDIVTTSAVLADHLQSLKFNRKVYVIGSPGIANELDIVGIEHTGVGPDPFDASDGDIIYDIALDKKVGAVVVGFDGHFSYPKLMKAASYLKDVQCLFIATNDDETVPSNLPHITVPGTGSILISVKEASSRTPVVLGKPNTPMYHYLVNKFNMNPTRTMMIGDRCSTDIKLAVDHKMKSMLVLTGHSNLNMVKKYKEDGTKDRIPTYYSDTVASIFDIGSK